eukprot:2005780-Pyramimonas_sp.AAC.1
MVGFTSRPLGNFLTCGLLGVTAFCSPFFTSFLGVSFLGVSFGVAGPVAELAGAASFCTQRS